MSPSSSRRSTSGHDLKGPQQVKSHLFNRNQTQPTRPSSVLDEKPHQSSEESSPTTFSRNDMAVVGSQETSLGPRISDWTQGVAQNSGGSGEGLIADYRCLLELYWDEICAAVERHRSKSPVEELFKAMDELRQKFRLLDDGEPQFDQRLARAPRIRNLLLIKLTVLTLDLRPGIRLFGPNIQTHLLRQTDACVSQAVSLTNFSLPEVREERSPADIIEFLDHAKCQDLKVRVKDIYGLLPEVNFAFENPEAIEDQRAQISRIDDRKFRILQGKVENLSRKLRELVPTHSREERSSRSANGGRVHPIGLSTLANFTITNQTPGLTDSSSDSPFSLGSTSRNSVGPMTDTNTSTSSSKVKGLHDGLEPFERFMPHQYILIEGPSGRNDEHHPVVFDSGTNDNFIISPIVKKYDLEPYLFPDGPVGYTHINGSTSYTDKSVKFRWKLCQGKKWHEATFFVIDELPDSLHGVVGYITSKQVDICLRAQLSALVAFRQKKEDTSAQEQRQHTVQTLSGSIRRDQKFKLNQERHADACQSETQKSQNLSLHDSFTKNQGYQQTESGKQKP